MRSPRKRLFLIAATIFVFLGISGGLLNIAWTYMQKTFDVGISDTGVLLLAATSGSLIAAFGSGSIIGRLGMGRVIMIGVIILCVGLLSISVSSTWLMLLVLIFLTYIGRGTLDAGLNNFVSAGYDSAAMNWLHASWGLGLTVAPAIVTMIIVTLNLGWQVAYVLASGLALILIVAILFNFRHWDTADGQIGEMPEKRLEPTRAGDTLKLPAVRWSLLLFFVYGGVEIGTGQLINTLLVEGREVSQEVASLWLSFYWGSFTVGRFLIGFVALRLSDQTILTGSTALALIGAILVIPPDLLTLNALGLILIGFGLAAIFPILIAQTPRRVGMAHSANTIGFQVGVAGFGAAILPGAFGLATESIGLEAIAIGICLNTILLMALNQWVAVRYPVQKLQPQPTV